MTPFLSPCSPCAMQRSRNLTLWVLCFVSSRSERTEGKTDGKRWKSKKKEGTMPAQPKCSFIFIINPKCTVKAVAITRGQSFLLIWVPHRLQRSQAGTLPKHSFVLEALPGWVHTLSAVLLHHWNSSCVFVAPCRWKALPRCWEFILSEFLIE